MINLLSFDINIQVNNINYVIEFLFKSKINRSTGCHVFNDLLRFVLYFVIFAWFVAGN